MSPTYRSGRTGKIGVYTARLAKHFPDLVEVGSDAKPLAYTAIPDEAIDELRAAQIEGGDGSLIEISDAEAAEIDPHSVLSAQPAPKNRKGA